MQPVAFHVPADLGEDIVPGGGETGRMCHLAAGDERERRGPGDPEQVLQPLSDDLLDDRRRRPAGVETGVLIPRRREPVRGERCGNRATDDEAEVPTARNGDDTLPGSLGEIFDDRAWVTRAVGERTAECLAQLLDGGGRPDRSFVERLDEIGRDLGGSS